MIELEQAICDIQADKLSVVDFTSPQWQSFSTANAMLFRKVQLAKPENHLTHHLLGLLTKAHIETLSRVTAHKDSVDAMQQAFDENLGEDHAARFQYQDGLQLVLVTHLWLYLQGYLGMDFSLANDHAEQTASTLVTTTGKDVHQLRSEFMASYYQARQLTENKADSGGLLSWLKGLFQR
ncbi:hypothetical protein [Vibrio rhodolitus]|uniref:hypothetical protein n=1 Tax=Vibrio rhodolitus TaxID=2231649 RepID=UPI0013DEE59C|nr:hypothetical protein [Vibrio rhodolitus]